jgi:peptide deformylase
MNPDLKIIHYPDPRLRKVSAPVTVFDQSLKDLAAQMLELMRGARGVGLAAPQVGINVRMFVMNPNDDDDDDHEAGGGGARVYVNPVLSDAEGEEEGEEGCLSLPQINAKIWRSKKLRINAQDLDGHPIEEIADGYHARIWQHEIDHLDGTMIIDRMGPVARLASRRILKDLQQKWDGEHPGEKKKK